MVYNRECLQCKNAVKCAKSGALGVVPVGKWSLLIGAMKMNLGRGAV